MFAQIEKSKRPKVMITFDPQTNPPKERIRYLVFDKTGWCIGDCFYGFATPDYWSYDLQVRVPRLTLSKQCWRYSEGERIVDIEVAFYAELPRVEL